jgi:hypothetical protein
MLSSWMFVFFQIVHQPGAAGHVIYQSRPRDYMAASIFACFCCFWPTGLCAIYFASQVKLVFLARQIDC